MFTSGMFGVWRTAGIAAFASVMLAGPATAQSTDAYTLQSRINQLEREMGDLRQQVYNGGGGAVAGGANPVRVDQLEVELRRLTGRLEETTFEIRKLRRDFEAFADDVEYRLQVLEGGDPAAVSSRRDSADVAASRTTASDRAPAGDVYAGTDGGYTTGAAPSAGGEGLQPGQRPLGTIPRSAVRNAPAGAAETAAAEAATRVTSSGPPKEMYDGAFALLMRRDFDGAEGGFRRFLAAYPGDPLAANAQYWLGETFYVRGDYETAATTFLDAYRNYPDGAKAPDSLLKLGMTLAQLGQTDDACLAFERLESDYPNASDTVRRRVPVEKGRNGC